MAIAAPSTEAPFSQPLSDEIREGARANDRAIESKPLVKSNSFFEDSTKFDEASQIVAKSLIESALTVEQELMVAGRRQAWLNYEVALQAQNARSPSAAGSEEESTPSEAAPTPPPWICFAQGTSAALIESIGANRAIPAPAGITGEITPLAFQYFSNSRWSRTAANPAPLARYKRADKIVLTWGIVSDGTMAPGLTGHPVNGQAAPSDLRARLNEIYGNESVWIQHFESVFNSWAERAGIRYVYQAIDDGAPLPNSPGISSVRPDIRISGRALDGNFGVLATNYGPDSGDMIIDTSDSFFENVSNNSRLFRNTLAHEHGHGLGLGHVCPVDRTKLMEPIISSVFDGPQLDDTFSIQRSYGDAYEDRDTDLIPEDNNTRIRPTDLGIFPLSTKTIQHLSIDDNDDEDYYRITPPVPGASLRVSLRPIGGNYLEGSQNNDGSCSPGDNFVAGSVHNLNFRILNSAGAVVASANSQPAGAAESVSAFVPPIGDLTIHVEPSTTTNRVQLYALDITFIGQVSLPVLSAAAASQLESDGSMQIQVFRTGGFPEAVSVNYSLESGSANAGQDFTPVNGTLTFNSSTTSHSISVPITNDALPEIDETFRIRLTNPINALIPVPTETLTIRDDDALVLVEKPPAISTTPEGRPILSWSAVPGRTYSVQRCVDMTNWKPVPGAAAIVADEAIESFTDPSPPDASRQFYRLVDSP